MMTDAALREKLAHLARDWDAQAAELERHEAGYDEILREDARMWRQCAQQLRELLGG
jgi:hypothetical protein